MYNFKHIFCMKKKYQMLLLCNIFVISIKKFRFLDKRFYCYIFNAVPEFGKIYINYRQKMEFVFKKSESDLNYSLYGRSKR